MANNKQNRNPNNNTNPASNNGKKKKGKKGPKAYPTNEGRRIAYTAMGKSIGTRMGQNLTQLMATPKEAQVVRMPTPDMPLVALLKSDSVLNVTHSTSGPTGFDAGTVNYYLFGQVARGLIYGPVVENTLYNYSLYTNNGYDNGLVFPLKTHNLAAVIGQDFYSQHTPDKCTATTEALSVGLNRPLGTKHGKNWLWMWPGERLEIHFVNSTDGGNTWVTGPTVPGVGTLYVKQTDGGSEPITWSGTKSVSTGVAVVEYWQCNEPGYYTFDASWCANNAATVYYGYRMRVYTQSSVSAYPMLTLPQVYGNPECIQKCRRTACSLLITNTSAEVYQQGNVIAARVKADYVTRIGKADLQAMADKYTGKARNGCYTYMDFSQGCEAFADCSDNNDTRETRSITYDLSWSELVHVISISSPNPATQANNYIVTMDAVIEFMTDKNAFTRAVSTGSFDQLVEARRVNNMSPYFFENPLHMADITRRINQFWNMLRQYSTPIGMGLSAAFPHASEAIMPVARFLQT